MRADFFLRYGDWSLPDELAAFDWRQLLQPKDLGCWPWSVRALVLLVSALMSAALILLALFLLSPEVSDDEHAFLASMRDQITLQQADTLAAAVNQLELEQQSIFSSLLLQQYSARVMDITQTLDVVAATASASGVQLLSLVPAVSRDDGPVVMSLRARVELSALSAFWFQLSQTLASASLTELVLLRTEKPGLFELSIGLRVPVRPLSDSPASRIDERLADESLPPVPASPAKGFFMRADSAQFVYLVSDNKGRLRALGQTKNAEQNDRAQQ